MKTNSCYKCDSTEKLTSSRSKRIKSDGTMATYYSYICSNCNKAQQKIYLSKRKEMVFDHYGRACICCGESIGEFLTIDHVNNNGNKERYASNGKRITGIQLYSLLVTRGFPGGYQTMCMNCNFGKRMNNGVCPHKSV